MSKKLSITTLANLLGAPRKTFNDWDKTTDYRKIIIELLKHLGEDEIKKIIGDMEKNEVIKIYTTKDLLKIFMKKFKTITSIGDEYEMYMPQLFGSGALLKHKNKNYKLQVRFKIRLPNLLTLNELLSNEKTPVLNNGGTEKIIILTDLSTEKVNQKMKEINPETGKPYIPEYATLLNIREALDIDNDAILLF